MTDEEVDKFAERTIPGYVKIPMEMRPAARLIARAAIEAGRARREFFAMRLAILIAVAVSFLGLGITIGLLGSNAMTEMWQHLKWAKTN